MSEIEILIQSAMGLIAILAILFFILFSSLSTKKKKQKKKIAKKKIEEEKHSQTNINYLRSVIKNKDSSTQQLKIALDAILEHHGSISENGTKKNLADFDIYMEIIFRLCRHPHVNKDLILSFCLELERKNPMYVSDINKIMFKGLTSRVV